MIINTGREAGGAEGGSLANIIAGKFLIAVQHNAQDWSIFCNDSTQVLTDESKMLNQISLCISNSKKSAIRAAVSHSISPNQAGQV